MEMIWLGHLDIIHHRTSSPNCWPPLVLPLLHTAHRFLLRILTSKLGYVSIYNNKHNGRRKLVVFRPKHFILGDDKFFTSPTEPSFFPVLCLCRPPLLLPKTIVLQRSPLLMLLLSPFWRSNRAAKKIHPSSSVNLIQDSDMCIYNYTYIYVIYVYLYMVVFKLLQISVSGSRFLGGNPTSACCTQLASPLHACGRDTWRVAFQWPASIPMD